MKKFLLIFFLISILNISAQTFDIKINDPINLMHILLDCPTEKSMRQVCLDYKLTDSGLEEGYQTFYHANGSILKCKLDTLENKKIMPVIKIQTKQPRKAIEKNLKILGYNNKKGNGKEFCYGNKNSITQKVCNFNKTINNNSLVITATKIYNN